MGKRRKLLLIIIFNIKIIFTISACQSFTNEVILGTDWNPGGQQFQGLQTIVNRFNTEINPLKKVKLKRIEKQRISASVGAGILGIKKLPNLYISYPDFILRQDLSLQENETGVKLRDLNEVLFNNQKSNNDVNDIIPQFLNESEYQNKLYVAPIGKSIDYMFINKRLVAEVFAKLNLEKPVRALINSTFNINDLIGEKGLIKIPPISDPKKIVNYNDLQKLTTLDEIKTFFKDWTNLIKFSQTANTILKMSKEKVNNFIMGIDDISAPLIAQYGNQGMLDDEDSIREKFLFGEGEEQTPIFNAFASSKDIFNAFLENLLKMKELSPRTAENPNRYQGIRLKTGRDDYNSNFFINNEMMINIGSSSGIKFLSQKKVKPEDILALPVPGKSSQQTIMQQGPGISMFELLDQSKNEVAEDFIRYLTRADINQAYAVNSGYLPIHQKSYQSDSQFLKDLKKLPSKYVIIIEDIINTINNKIGVFKTAPLTFSGQQVRYQVVSPAIQNFIEDIDVNGKYNVDGVTIEDTWKILKGKLNDEFSSKFIWREQ